MPDWRRPGRSSLGVRAFVPRRMCGLAQRRFHVPVPRVDRGAGRRSSLLDHAATANGAGHFGGRETSEGGFETRSIARAGNGASGLQPVRTCSESSEERRSMRGSPSRSRRSARRGSGSDDRNRRSSLLVFDPHQKSRSQPVRIRRPRWRGRSAYIVVIVVWLEHRRTSGA